MRLSRLRVAELRAFRTPFELAALQPGLNLIGGANETGKSTLVRALRAAFFERHRSTSVDDLRPYGDSAAAPAVELDFEIGGTEYALRKSFLGKKRCELRIGTRRLEGVDAEDHLAELLGFGFAGKGASREEHWGIPGLLWIEQGSAQAVQGAVEHAAVHLQTALNESVGEVAASGGDELLARVRTLRNELLGSTGKPRAAHQQAIEEAAALQAQADERVQRVAIYRSQVDQLRTLREAHAAGAAAKPWRTLRERQALAQQALEQAQGLARRLAAEAAELQRTRELHALLLQQLAGFEQQRQALAGREAALVQALQQQAQAQAVEQQAVVAGNAAAARERAARNALALARQEHNRALLQRQLDEAQGRAATAAAMQQRALAEHDRVAALQHDALAGRIEPADLKRLREQAERLRELQIRQAAVATRLGFELEPGQTLRLGDEPLQGQGERLLATPASLHLPGIGRLHIAPGGADLPALAREQATLQDAQQAQLQRLGLARVADAEARDQAQRQKAADAAAAAKALALLAPQGLPALQAELDALHARRQEAAAALAQLPPAPAGGTPALAAAEAAHDAERTADTAAAAALQTAREQLAAAASRHDGARQERDALRELLADPQRQTQQASRQAELVATTAQRDALQLQVSATEATIAAARPDILAQDVERLRRSADEAERHQQSLGIQLVQLESALAAAGAQGLEEELAARQGQLAQALRRRDELQRRAAALDHLLSRLELRRQALTRRLQAPLQKHLDRYLQLLFPSARLAVDDRLAPGALTRPGVHGPEHGDFDTLSFGAREQIGLISRLACADLLQAAGRPTLLILDDALVHSDPQRLGAMKRVLFDAAMRHQLLLFTCQPERWHDMGVPLRALEEEIAAQRAPG